MKVKEYIAYAGEAFTIEWYIDAQGHSPALEYFRSLSEDRQDQALFLFKRMGDFGRISDLTKFRNEGDKIFAFKPQPDRYLCFFIAGKKIVISNAFEKRSQKLPRSERLRALKAYSDYQSRVKTKTYY
jgi:hypothetical protein